MLEFLQPVEHFGRKFDRGCVLFEFDALREPEKTRFPLIGAWLRAKGIEFNEVPTPSMLWRGRIWPDLYISNQLEAVPNGWHRSDKVEEISEPAHARNKAQWHATDDLDTLSIINHGVNFHDAFIDPMCRKITGRPSSEIAAKYHRAVWLPLYWPQTLRARASIRTPFYYPTAGYVGRVAEGISRSHLHEPSTGNSAVVSGMDQEEISVSYIIAAPRAVFSVIFIVDDSPIYRVTDMDACAGLSPEFHRFVVEYRGECNVEQELERMQLTYHPRHMAFDSVRLTLPTIENVRNGWKPRPTINDQLWSMMNDA